MSSFTFPPPSPPEPDDPDTIANDGWFPDVDLALLIKAVRIDAAWDDERLREAAVMAIISVNGELAAWKALRVAEGYADLAAVPADQVGGESVQLARYRRAVQSFCAADLMDRNRDVGLTRAGQERADELETTADAHRRNGRWAVSEILGLTRTRVELL